ncbi:MAG TPA: hypothetical protein VME42_05115 [Steroidobacteraceae bacterium]|nr:hypothetical protein [Steroidobacteraceae bacterium]
MATAAPNRWAFLTDPLKGKTPLGRVIWLYGIVGSFAYSALGLFFDVTDERALLLYSVGGLLYTVYVTIATYRCAGSVKSALLRNLVRASAVLTLLLLPLLAYLSFSGVLALSSLGGIE